jgi:hypothetical protein
MGTYNNSVFEIADKIAEALDNIEGDFNKKTLLKALKLCESYPHVTDNIPKTKK